MEKLCNTETPICQENSLHHHFFFSFSLLCLAPCYSSKWPFVTLVLSSSYRNFSSASFTFLSLLPCCPHSFCSLPPQFMPVDGGIQQVLGVPASLPLSLLSVQLGSTESCSCASLSVPGWLSQQWPAWTRSTSSAKLLFIFLLVKSVKELSDWQRVINVTRDINYLLWCIGFGRTLCTHFCGVTQQAGRGCVGFVACYLAKK